MTNIEMEWTDTGTAHGGGARVLSTVYIKCPRCNYPVAPNVEHLCGDRLPKPDTSKPARKSRTKVAKG